MPLPLQHFYMIRHGETEANRARVIAGSTDSPLTDKGRLQAQRAQKIVENLTIKPTQIIHSNLSRARDTALTINQNLRLPTFENPDYAEWHFGSWEGMAFDDYFGDNKHHKPNDWPDPPGDGETQDQFTKRVQLAKTAALSNHPPALVVSHGGVFRAFGLLYGRIGALIDNCVLYEFKPTDHAPFPWEILRHDENGAESVTLFEPMET